MPLVKFSAAVEQGVLDDLTALAHSMRCSKVEALRRAIPIAQYLSNEYEAGKTFHVTDLQGHTEQVRFVGMTLPPPIARNRTTGPHD